MIDEHGTIIRNGRVRKPFLDKDGYLQINLFQDGKRSYHRVHRLVAFTFIPNPLNDPCINHIDGNKLNNHITNLEWCTIAENCLHAMKIGLNFINNKGEESINSKLTQEEVNYIRQMYIPRDRQFGQTALAKRFGVTQSVISRIIHFVLWPS